MANPQFSDDPTLSDETELWRRIPPWNWIYDENERRFRPKSTAFTDHPNGSPMSVAIATESGRADRVLAGHEGYALAAITAGLAGECGLMVARDPLPDNPAHAVVVGRKTESVRRRLAHAARWVVPPPAP